MTPQERMNAIIRRWLARWTQEDMMTHPGAYIDNEQGAIDDGVSYGADERPAWIREDLAGWQPINDENGHR
jgi:hypothetical protein